MVLRVFAVLIGLALAVGFLWFATCVVMLGLKDFFSSFKEGKNKKERK